MIKVKDLSKEYYAGETLFKGVNFVISGQEKVALTGPNGCGKTTLLKIISGIEPKSGGSLLLESEKVGYLPQELDLPFESSVGEFLSDLIEKTSEKYLVESLLSQFDLNDLDLTQKIHSFSGGEQMRLKLTEILLEHPTLLLLDEPTNHLDIDGILWFEEFIQSFRGAVLMISHDRSFMNNTVSRIFEIENCEFHIFVGNYDSYQEQKKQFVEKRNAEYTRFLKKKEKLDALLVLAHKIVAGNRNAVNAAKSRYEREIVQGKVEKYEVARMGELSLAGGTHGGKLIVGAKNAFKNFGSKKVLDGVDFEIRGTEKVWLFGPNGTGKSTLVKLIYSLCSRISSVDFDELTIDSGELKVGNNLKVGYFAQANAPINLDSTVFDFFRDQTGFNYDKAYGMLEQFLFTKDFYKRKLKTLSPGQRARLKLAVFSVNEYDFLILDEPTNHLDIASKEVVEEALRNYNGALLLVSHDRYFVSEVGVDKVLELREGKIVSRYLD